MQQSMQAMPSHYRLLPVPRAPDSHASGATGTETLRSKCSLDDLSTFVTGKSYKNAQTSPEYTTDALSLACALRRRALEDMGKDVDLPVFDQLPCPCPSAWPCGALLPADRP